MTYSFLVAAIVSTFGATPIGSRIEQKLSNASQLESQDQDTEEESLDESAELQSFYFGDWTMDTKS